MNSKILLMLTDCQNAKNAVAEAKARLTSSSVGAIVGYANMRKHEAAIIEFAALANQIDFVALQSALLEADIDEDTETLLERVLILSQAESKQHIRIAPDMAIQYIMVHDAVQVKGYICSDPNQEIPNSVRVTVDWNKYRGQLTPKDEL